MSAMMFWLLIEMQSPVKQCIDLRTQTIVTVPAGMPCPYPTVEY